MGTELGIRQREAKRSVVGSLIAMPTQRSLGTEKAWGAVKARKTEKVQKAYYLEFEIAKKVKVIAAEKGLSASEIVENALREYLGEEC